ncbi:MAG: hypothetical protein F4Y91_09200, partial [Gemmatimonadetes bacterium]|nr:hypothetical protein [Gemmatimonadota bacterium]
MPRKMTAFWLLPLALFTMLMGCTVEMGARVVAQIGDEEITVDQLRKFIDGLSEDDKAEATRVEEAQNHLNTMINIQLLIMEAKAADLDKSPEFRARLERIQREKLTSIFSDRALEVEEEVEEGEVREYAERMGLTRAVRLADIMVSSRENALSALRELNNGVPFGQVAQKWSINKKTSAQGGDLGRYTTRENMITPLQDKLFSLALGEVSEPIKIGGNYSIFTVIADSTIELSPQRKLAIQMGLKQEKKQRALSTLVADLKKKYHLELDREGLALIVEKARGGASFASETERNIVLYRYDGGEITAQNLADAGHILKGNALAQLSDSSQVIAFAERHVVPNAMLVEAALRAGIDEEAETVEWLENQANQLLISALRARLLRAKVTIAENELRQFYKAHAERYMHPEQIEVQEILVETEAEALRLMKQLQKGATFGDLARKYSIRSLENRD